ncbi:hypothetical protein DENSPDRAFT_839264 [Dentipellis sp. KUC8613]|nr:hypothetical protein DENSPDRAFT_839264 [Dentipellis sp. KUC8613]
MAPTPAHLRAFYTNPHIPYGLGIDFTLRLDTAPLDSYFLDKLDRVARPPSALQHQSTPDSGSRDLRLHRRQTPAIATELDSPPPPYTPSLALHAPTLGVSDSPNPGVTGAGTPPPSPMLGEHSANMARVAQGRVVVVVVLIGVVVLAAVAGAGHVMLKRRGGRIAAMTPVLVRKKHPRKLKMVQGIKGGPLKKRGKVDYDDSTWGTPAAAKVKSMIFGRSAEKDGPDLDWVVVQGLAPIQETLAHTDTASSVLPVAEVTELRVTNPDLEDQAYMAMPAFPSGGSFADQGTVLSTIEEADEQDVSEVALAAMDSSEDPLAFDSQEVADIAHALGLALQTYSGSASTLESGPGSRNRCSLAVSPEDTILAAMALRSGMESVSVRAKALGRPRKGSNASTMTSGSNDGVTFSPISSTFSSATSFSSEQADEGVEDHGGLLFEVRRAQPRSMEFGRGIVVSVASVSDLKSKAEDSQDSLPRFVVSASTSSENDMHYLIGSRSITKGDSVTAINPAHLSAYSSGTSMSLDDFPSPPVLLDTVKRISTSLTSEIENSLNMTLAKNPYLSRSSEQPAIGALIDGAQREERLMLELKRRLQERLEDRQVADRDSENVYIL